MSDNKLIDATGQDPDEQSLLEAMLGPMAKNAMRVMSIPGDVYSGKIPFEQIQPAARDFAANVGGAGIGASRLIGAPEGALGIFAGQNAATANKQALAIAQDMATHGRDATAIWDRTGWFQGADKRWRFEIPDQKAGFFPAEGPGVGDVVEHQELFKAYPELQNLAFNMKTQPVGQGGVYHSGQAIEMAPDMAAMPEAGKSVMLHELQHGVQDIEGFGFGAAPDWFLHPRGGRRLLHEAYPELGEFYQQTLKPLEEAVVKAHNEGASVAELKASPLGQAFNEARRQHDKVAKQLTDPAYYRSAGEVEARNVQKRMNMSDLQRQVEPPWETQSVPNQTQIVFGKDGKALSLTPIDYDPFAER